MGPDLRAAADRTHTARRPAIGVRVDPGMSAHILGMRVLPFVRDRYPDHDIHVLSDAGAGTDTLDLIGMSPFVSPMIAPRANLVIEAGVDDMFTTAAICLQIPVFEILRQRFVVTIPADASTDIDRQLGNRGGVSYVALNLGHDSEALKRCEALMANVVHRLIDLPDVRLLQLGRGELAGLSRQTHRIVSCPDLPVRTVAALLGRCRYFVGVDDGLRHLAWGLGLPSLCIVAERPRLIDALQWMPDLHCAVHVESPRRVIERHVAAAVETLRG